MKNILIVFTINDDDTKEAYFDKLFPSQPLVIKWKLVFFNYQDAKKENCDFTPDVILINDKLDLQEAEKACLKSFISKSERIFVLYHTSNKQTHQESFEGIVRNCNKSNNCYCDSDHHNCDGKIMGKIQLLVSNRELDRDKYDKQLKTILTF